MAHEAGNPPVAPDLNDATDPKRPKLEHHMFYPDRAELERGRQPTKTVFHDVLVVPPEQPPGEAQHELPKDRFFRFPVRKVGERQGRYVDPPELWDARDDGQRKVMELANPGRTGEDHDKLERGPLFSILPVKAEPGASSCAFCYLVNPRHGNSPNAWSAEEWNTPGLEDLQAAPGADDTSARILLALPRGVVLDFQVDGLDKLTAGQPVPAARFESEGDRSLTYRVRPVQLRSETEIWSQLRNGCVVGTTLLRSANCVVPLVNVTSLTPTQTREAAAPGKDPS